VRDEYAVVSTTYEQARSAKVPPGIPVTLMTAMQDPKMPAETRRIWAEKHKEWIDKIPRGRHIVAEKSRHMIQVDEPQLVIEAIGRWLVRRVVSPPRRNAFCSFRKEVSTARVSGWIEDSRSGASG